MGHQHGMITPGAADGRCISVRERESERESVKQRDLHTDLQ